MRLAIAVPTRDYVPAAFANDLAELYAYTKQTLPDVEVAVHMHIATLVHMGREKLMGDVVNVWGATHVLWLDSDMTFPRSTAVQLLQHNVDIVGCNCASRSFPSEYTALLNGQRVPTTSLSFGLRTVDSVGMAVFLMRASVLKNIPQPWFAYSYPHGTEDGWFCKKLREAGHSIHIDNDLSKEIGHIGMFTYRLEHIRRPHGYQESQSSS